MYDITITTIVTIIVQVKSCTYIFELALVQILLFCEC